MSPLVGLRSIKGVGALCSLCYVCMEEDEVQIRVLLGPDVGRDVVSNSRMESLQEEMAMVMQSSGVAQVEEGGALLIELLD